MRKIEFNELKLSQSYDEYEFYNYYLKHLNKKIINKDALKKPEKKYEIFYLNILNGKIILLDKNYLPDNNLDNQELFFDYKTAYEIYNKLLDIYDGIENEQYEFNELYKNERLKINSDIEELKLKDDEIFNNKLKEYANSATEDGNGEVK
jgi:hypothetical protein